MQAKTRFCSSFGVTSVLSADVCFGNKLIEAVVVVAVEVAAVVAVDVVAVAVDVVAVAVVPEGCFSSYC